MRSYKLWLVMMVWCKSNPEKIAGIVTPDGLYSITYKPKPNDLTEYHTVEYDS